jgi:lysophospholipase L1-like esterase
MQSDVMGRSKSTEWLGGDTSDAGGGQSSYSELAIEAGVMLRLAFHLGVAANRGADGLHLRPAGYATEHA